MTSSLTAQLAKGTSLNTTLLVDRSKRKHAESYLFTGKEANHHDLYSVHALALNGFTHLRSIDPIFGTFEQALFSDAAKSVDRTLLTREKEKELSSTIGRFLKLLGPYVLDSPAGKVLEWLVRRFRINEFNVDDTLALFLPYHETPHFTKLLSILHVEPQSTWHFLLAYKSAVKGLPRFALVTEMLKNTDLLRFIASLLPEALRGGYSHRTLINFHTAALVEYISRTESLDPGSAVVFLSNFLEPLVFEGSVPKDAILSSFILFSILSQTSRLTSNATQSIIRAIVGSIRHGIEPTQVITAVLSICAPQEKLSKIPRSLVRVLLESPDMAGAVSAALGWAGSEKFLVPLLNPLVGRVNKPPAYELLTLILSSSETPAVVVKELARMLIELLSRQTSTIENKEHLWKLLTQLRQQHPGIFSEASSDAAGKSDEDHRAKIEQLILSLCVTNLDLALSTGLGSRVADLILASMDSDPGVRAAAVKGLLEKDGDDKEISAALASRAVDTSSTVLEALYSKPSALLPHLKKGYLEATATVLSSSATPRQLIRLHVTFLLHHFVKAYPSAISVVVERCLWPFLLFTKAKQKTSSAVWDILESEDCSDEVADFQLLRGSLVVLRGLEQNAVASHDEGASDYGLQKLATIDIALANRIADNIILSEKPLDHVDFILGVLSSENHNGRTLGYLVVRALLGRLSGQHQLDVAQRTVQAMGIETLSGMEGFMKGSDDLQSFINDASLASCVVHKPGSKTTLNRLKVAVLTLIPTIPRPVNCRINWLGPATQPNEDTRGAQYVTLATTVYMLANAASTLPLLSMHLLRALFVSLKDDALVFLAGVWTSVSCDLSAEVRNRIQLAALSHASAFLLAYEGAQGTIDFQTIVPPILAMLGSTNPPVRAAAVQCLSVIGRLSQAGKPKAIYAFDSVYGTHSDKLQFLDRVDFQKYILALVDQGGHLVNDVDYLSAFQQQYLTRHKSDSKKDSGFKHRVICYLVSHAVACHLPHIRASILKSLRDVPDVSKASMLISVFKECFEGSEGVTILTTVDQEFLEALVRAFDKNSAKDLNDKEGALWQIFTKVLRACLIKGPGYSPNALFKEALKGGLFRKLSLERQIALSQFLLDLGGTAEAAIQCKSILALVLEEESLLLNLLRTMQPVVSETSAPATKKARLDGQHNQPSFTADKLQPLTLLVEVIGGNQTFNGSKDLIVLLLDTLEKIVHCTGTSVAQSDITYLEQLLMSVMGELADRLPSDNVSTADIKFDVLIQIIRLSDNPQTFHQALLLISSLAHLAPEAVLRNVMPIFTFMGSSILHRDDEYSFKVVQKTIDSVLPVMTSSLRSKHTNSVGLHVALRDFLSIFTDAANHIPRHRRIGFFVHLTEVLGGAEFLSPISMLLVEKVAGRVVRQSHSDAQASLSIPLSLLNHYGEGTQVQALKDVVQESGRILTHAFKLELTEPTFLDLARNDEDGSSLIIAKRRAHALLLFVNHALRQTKAPIGGRANDILPLLLQISALASTHSDEKQATEIDGAARTCLNSVLGIIPAAEFVSCVTTLLTGVEDKRIKSGALNLVAERILKLSNDVRNSSSSPVLKILGTVKLCLAGNDEESVQSSLKALDSLARTMVVGEENAFAELIPTVLPLIHSESWNQSAIDALGAICTKLGPRVIPNLKAVILESTKLIGSEVQEGTPSSSVSIKALRVLQGLLSTIPSFWTADDINLVIDLYLLHDVTTETSVMANLIKTVAKRVPSSVLIPTLCDTWKRLKESSATTSFGAFFLLLKKAIHAAPRGELLHQLRSLFNVFVDGFAVQVVEETSDGEVEHETISAFLELVVKLNETTFKPLFRKLYDWAFTQESDEKKRAVFCRVYTALLDYFRTLMTPYMSFMVQAFTDLLESFTKSEEPDQELWGSLVQVLGKSFEVDEAAFWQEDRLKQISGPLISQIPIVCNIFVGTSGEANRGFLSNALCALATAVGEDYDERGGGSGGALLKSLNLGILMQTRSEDAKQRIFSVQCATELWKANGIKLVGFVTETATFIAELAEDDNDTVVKETRRLKKAVEDVGGSIDKL